MNKKTIPYKEFAHKLNTKLKKPVLKNPIRAGDFLRPVCRKTYAEFKVLPGSVVVSKTLGIPSKGYFNFVRSLGINFKEPEERWRLEVARFFKFCEELNGNILISNDFPDIDSVLLHIKEQLGK